MIYYIYAYLRNKDSTSGKIGTPYYIGKGSGNRAYDEHDYTTTPTNRDYIVIMEEHLSELGAFALERFYIRWYGRKDLNTGILNNRTDGGEGAAGRLVNQETRQKLSIAQTTYYNSLSHEEQIERNLKTKIPTTSGLRWDEDTKKKMSNSQLGKVAINNGEKYIKVDKHLLNDYLLAGWLLGKLRTGNIYINQNGDIKKISPDDLSIYVADGWFPGRGPMPQERKDKIGISNAGKKKKQKTEEEKDRISSNISARLKNEWATGKRKVTGMTGKHQSEETKNKISLSVSKKRKDKKDE